MIILLVIVAIIVIVLLYIGMTYNSFISVRNRIEEAFSTMDVYLQKRYDLIPNLVETVKGYAKHEKETLGNVIAARNGAVNATSIDDKIAAEGEVQKTLGRLFAVAEAYPDLKANTNFLDLQTQLKDMETEIAQSRKYYNAVVKIFNTKVEQFPSNIIANMFKFRKATMFEIESEEARKNVKVEF